jgi:UDP:flavonoid glycosyltransferase YjiC (YdhE family)
LRSQTTAESLAKEMNDVLNDITSQKKASDIGAQMKNENGVLKAVHLISNLSIK